MSIWGHARNVNLRSRPGRISDTYITRRSRDDISCRWRTGRTARLALRNVRICGAKCINECWTQPTAADSGWEKTKKQRSQPTVESQESDRRTTKSSKVESTYWRFLTSQVFRLTLHVTVVLWTPTILNEQRLTPAPRAPSAHSAWRLKRREASCACVVLVLIHTATNTVHHHGFQFLIWGVIIHWHVWTLLASQGITTTECYCGNQQNGPFMASRISCFC